LGYGTFLFIGGEIKFVRAYVAATARHNAARLALCYFFLIQERSNQESELGRSLRGLPFRATLQGGTREIKYTLFMLCLKLCQHAWQALKAKTFALMCLQVSLTCKRKR
jgi:hypothetical protein